MITGSRQFWYDRTLQYQGLRESDISPPDDPSKKYIYGGLALLGLTGVFMVWGIRSGYFDFYGQGRY